MPPKAKPRRKANSPAGALRLSYRPVTEDRWDDLVELFGSNGGCAGCWCMWWRISAREWNNGKGAGNRRALRKLVATGAVPGILAYHRGRPVGWCAVGPREDFPRMEGSRVLARVDDAPVWSIACLFVARPYRRRGVSEFLVRSAAVYASSRGATIVEAYPKDVEGEQPDAFVWTGMAGAFRKAGFVEVARRSPTKPVLRLRVGGEP